MILGDITDRVSIQFADEAWAQINLQKMIRWVNDAQREICEHNPNLLRTKSTTPTVVGQSDYSLPNNLLRLHSVKYRGNYLKGISLQQAEEDYINKDDPTTYPRGNPLNYWVYGNLLSLYPAPDYADNAGLTIYYDKYPTSIAVSALTPLNTALDLPDKYLNRIVDYCLAQARELDNDPAGYQQKMDRFTNDLSRMKSLEESHSYYPFITDLGGY